MNRNAVLGIMALCHGIMLCATSPAMGQIADFIPFHDFSDRKSIPLVCGKVIGLSDDAVQVEDGFKLKHVLSLGNLSSNDLKFIKSIRSLQKDYAKQRSDAEKLVEKLNDGSPNQQIKVLRRLKTIGAPVSAFNLEIAKLAISTPELDVAIAALETYLAVCPKTEKSLATLTEILRAKPEIKKLIATKPGPYFESLVRFGPLAETILIDSAFVGRVLFAPAKEKPAKPETLPTTKGPRNSIRAAASLALSQVKTGRSANATLELVTAAEQPINNSIDHETIRQILIGSAKGGRVIAVKWVAIAKKYENAFAKEIQAWRKLSKLSMVKAVEQSRMQSLSRMRIFKDGNNNFLLRGKLESFSDGIALIKSQDNKRMGIGINKFSEADKKWIQENSEK